MGGEIKVNVEELETTLKELQTATEGFEQFFNDFKNTVSANLSGQDSAFVNEYRYIVESMQDNIDRKQIDQVKKIRDAAEKSVAALKKMDTELSEQFKKEGK